jgi:hypothetical protein
MPALQKHSVRLIMDKIIKRCPECKHYSNAHYKNRKGRIQDGYCNQLYCICNTPKEKILKGHYIYDTIFFNRFTIQIRKHINV